MRIPASRYLFGLLATLVLTLPAFAQLPTKSELILEKYEEERAKGVTALNKRYIAAFEKELDLALAARELEEANTIQLKIQSLKTEMINLDKAPDTPLSSTVKITIDPEFLVGKTLGIPFNHDPTKTAYFSFQAEEKALWLGPKNQKVERAYKPTGRAREFLLWWPGRPDGFGTYVINIDADGKTATVTERSSNEIVNGVIEDAD